MQVLKVDYEKILSDVSKRMEKNSVGFAFYAEGYPIRAGELVFRRSTESAINYATTRPDGVEMTPVSLDQLRDILEAGKKIHFQPGSEPGKVLEVVDLSQLKELTELLSIGKNKLAELGKINPEHLNDKELNHFAKQLEQVRQEFLPYAALQAGSAITDVWHKKYLPFHDGMPIEKWYTILKEKFMKQNFSTHNENQYKRLGLHGAHTPEIAEQMNKGVSPIVQEYKAIIEGESTSVTIHSRKLPNTNLYFINKMDVKILNEDGSVKKYLDTGTEMKQTFYINNNRQLNKESDGQSIGTRKEPLLFTLKRAFNYIFRRPVYDQKNDRFQKINVHHVLPNGNYAGDVYDKKYFNLKNVSDQYNWKYKGNAERMSNLHSSLERGNLQNADLINSNGKKETVAVSINVTGSYLNLYDKDGKISLEKQIERGLISKEYGEKLLMAFEEKKQSQKPVVKEEQKQSSKFQRKQSL